MSYEQPPRGRLGRLFEAADRRRVPLRTIAVLAGASLGTLIGGISGGFVAALLAIPTAGALQVLVKEVWQATAADQPQESPAAAAEPAEKHGNPVASTGPYPAIQASELS
jgi:hypothetical protein